MYRVLPPAASGSPRNTRTIARFFRGVLVVTLVTALGLGATVAHADELDDKKKKIDQQIAASKADLHEANEAAGKAAVVLAESNKSLLTAEHELSQAETAESEAQTKDAQAAADLAAAQKKLAKARAEAKKAADEVDEWNRTVGRTVVQAQQQRTDLLGLAVLTTDKNMSTLNSRAQWTRTMLDSTQAKLDRLKSLQFTKEAAEQKAAEAEAEVNKLREQAKQAYTDAQNATQAKESARDKRANAVALNLAAKKDADDEVTAEKKRQDELKAESDAVGARIQQRIAAQKAAEAKAEAARKKAEADRKRAEEEARKAAAAAAAAERKAKAAQAAAAKAKAKERARANAAAAKAKQDAARAKKTNAQKQAVAAKQRAANKTYSRSSPKKSSPNSGGLIYPSGAMITSPFGQRFHPILRYWKLHDGTDFGAACGTPIKAATDGVVSEKYYNAGYGNRLIVDHGTYQGRFLSTAYNHATRYIVSVGQRVKQGQTLGYVGSTGYSTGCHLHYMAYVNGNLVNPMSLY